MHVADQVSQRRWGLFLAAAFQVRPWPGLVWPSNLDHYGMAWPEDSRLEIKAAVRVWSKAALQVHSSDIFAEILGEIV